MSQDAANSFLAGEGGQVSDDNIKTGLWISACIGAGLLAVVSILQRTSRLYRYRLTCPTVTNPPPPLETQGLRSLWDWLYQTITVSDLKLLESAGLDALVMVKCCVLGIQLFLPWAIIGCAVLIPINMRGLNSDQTSASTSAFMKLTVSNLEPNSPFLWVHFLVLWINLAYALTLMAWHYKQILLVQQHYLKRGGEPNMWRGLFDTAYCQPGKGSAHVSAWSRIVGALPKSTIGELPGLSNGLSVISQLSEVEQKAGLGGLTGMLAQPGVTHRSSQARAVAEGVVNGQAVNDLAAVVGHQPQPGRPMRPSDEEGLWRNGAGMTHGPEAEVCLELEPDSPPASVKGKAVAEGSQPQEEVDMAAAPIDLGSTLGDVDSTAIGGAAQVAPVPVAAPMRNASLQANRDVEKGPEPSLSHDPLMDLDGIPRWWDVLKVDTSVMSNSDERSTLSKTAAVAAKTAGLHAIGNDEGDVKGGAKVPCGPLGYIWTACGQGVGGDDGTGDGPTIPLARPSVSELESINAIDGSGKVVSVLANRYAVLVTNVRQGLYDPPVQDEDNAAVGWFAHQLPEWLKRLFRHTLHPYGAQAVTKERRVRSDLYRMKSASMGRLKSGRMRSTVHNISAHATGMMATGDSISAADGFGASGKGQAALRWRKATAHCMQQQQQESLSASGKGSYADDSSDDEDDGRLGSVGFSPRAAGKRPGSVRAPRMAEVLHQLQVSNGLEQQSSSWSAKAGGSLKSAPSTASLDTSTHHVAVAKVAADGQISAAKVMTQWGKETLLQAREAKSKWALVRYYVGKGKVRRLPGKESYSIVSSTFKSLFPQDFDRAVPVINHREVDQLLERMDLHLQQYEVARLRQQRTGQPYCKRLGPCGLWGPKVDWLEHHKAQILLLRDQVKDARKRAYEGKSTTSWLVFFHTQAAAAVATQCVVAGEGSRRFRVHPAPGPEEVMWSTLWCSKAQRRFRRQIVRPLAVFLLALPAGIFTGSLMQLDYLLCPVNTCADKLAAARVMADQTLFKQLSAQCGSSDSSGTTFRWTWYCDTTNNPLANVLRRFVVGWLPALLLSVWQTAVLPACCYLLVLASRDTVSLSKLDRRVAYLFAQYALFNAFLGGVLGATVTQGIRSMIRLGPSELLNLIGTYVPSSSNFFLNFVTFRALVSIPLRMLWPHNGIQLYIIRRYLRLTCHQPTQREHALLQQPVSPRYGFELGMLILIFTIASAFAIVSPIILPMAVAFFTLSWLFWRWTLLYIFVRKYESGGRFFTFFFGRLLACQAVMMIFTACVFITKAAFIQAIIILILCPIILVKYRRFCYTRYQLNQGAIPLEVACAAPPTSVDPWVYLPPPLHHKLAGWHPEWAKAWQGWGLPAYGL